MSKENNMEYLFNAVHYCMWHYEKESGRSLERIINALFAPIQKYLFTKSFKEKYNKHLSKEQNDLNEYFYGCKNGLSIGNASHDFGYFYSGYSIFLSFILIGIADRLWGNLHSLTVLLLFALPVGLCYIPAYSAVFSNDCYLKYFKQFEKKDERWHKKWKRITILFIIGSIVSTFMGIVAMWAIEHLL